MDALECIMTRRSVRKFKKIPVEWFKVGQVIQAGINAPSAGNLQDFRLMVITKEQLKIDIAKYCMNQMWMTDAAVYILISSTYTRTKRFYGVRGERLYSIQSCAAVAENILLAAHSLGLGACWVGAFDEDSIRQACNIPDYNRLQVVIPIGYPDEMPPTPPKYQLEVMVHLNRWADNSGKVWNIPTEMLKDWSPHVVNAIDKTKENIKKNSDSLANSITNSFKKLHQNIKGKLGEKAEKRRLENLNKNEPKP